MPPTSDGRLESWKEIATYLRRSVRTVRRWEREEGLPVHRHVHRTLGSVYAEAAELEAWRAAASRAPEAAGAMTAVKAIAVLPFANLSDDRENEYFAGGLTDEIMAKLSNVRALRVISRTSSRIFRGTNKDAKTIAGELRVRYLLEGSVRRAGNRLRITARLIDATADEHLWADTYDGALDDVFAIQERLARMIVDALELRLASDEEQRLSERPIDNLAAYECYLRARQEGYRWRKDAIDHAVQLLRNGLAIIGENARLYAALGTACLQYREAGIDFGEGPLADAEACEAKVFSLERASASALQLRGWIHYSRARTQAAVRDLRAALDLDSGNADTLLLLSNCYLISGRVPEARPLIARLLEVDPLTPVSRCMPAWADILEGDFTNAAGPYRQMFEMDPSNPMARLFYVWVLLLTGRDDEVSTIVDGFPPETRDTVAARLTFFLAYARRGDRAAAQTMLTPDLESLALATDVFARFLAQGFALADMPGESVHWLAIAVDRGFINYPFLERHDPFFANIRQDARFRELLTTVRERWMAFAV
jgi:TolB-like protein